MYYNISVERKEVLEPIREGVATQLLGWPTNECVSGNLRYRGAEAIESLPQPPETTAKSGGAR